MQGRLPSQTASLTYPQASYVDQDDHAKPAAMNATMSWPTVIYKSAYTLGGVPKSRRIFLGVSMMMIIAFGDL